MEFMTVNEIMKEFRLSRSTVNRMLKRGDFKNAFKAGFGETSGWRIPRSDLEVFRTRHEKYNERKEEKTNTD